MAKPVIMIGTPCAAGLVTQAYMNSIIKLMKHADFTCHAEMHLTSVGNDSLITRARATIVAAFLDDPAATHLLFVDADIAFEPDQVDRMLAFDKDVVGGLYPIKAIDWGRIPARFVHANEPLAQAGLEYVGDVCSSDTRRQEAGFVTARHAGTGFLLIKRQVFRRLIEAYPETRYRAIQVYPAPAASEHQYALFDCSVDPETGIYLSEDYAFCRRWRQIGGEIWLDLQSKLAHVGAHSYRGDAALRHADLLSAADSR